MQTGYQTIFVDLDKNDVQMSIINGVHDVSVNGTKIERIKEIMYHAPFANSVEDTKKAVLHLVISEHVTLPQVY